MAILGKASVPNQVNDRVAPQGSLGQLIYVRKSCRSLFLLLGKKNKKILALAVQKLFKFFWDT